jgi:hypothetical protein
MSKFVLESDSGNEWVTEDSSDNIRDLHVSYEFCKTRDSSEGNQLLYRIRDSENNEIVWESH